LAKGSKTLTPRRVTSAEDRNAGRGGFITLKKTNDFFEGYALFIPDPEVGDNPGWYEYFEHYTPATGYCPCAGGDDCPLCEEGDNASTRAKTLWLIDGEVKVFTINYYVLQEFVDMKYEDENVLGQKFKIKRLEGNGKYSIRNKNEKLTKAELKAALKDVDDDMLEKMATKQMRRVMQEMDASDAMEEDDDKKKDDDDEEPKGGKSSKSKKGKPADEEPEPDADEFDPEEADDADELTVTVVKAKKKDNILTVMVGDEGTEFDIYGTDEVDLTENKKGDEIVVSFEKDDDGDFVVSEVGEAEAEPEAGYAEDSYDEELVTITSVNSEEDTLTVETEDGTEFDLFFLDDGEDDNGRDWKELDMDDYKEGQQVKITAAKDDDGDMLASVFPEPVEEKKGKGGKKSGGKKGGKKSGK
jgi:hypothetical protein